MVDLITVQEFKDYKRISSTTYDTQLSILIPQASSFIKTYCGNSFNEYTSTDKVEWFNGRGNTTYFVQEWPLVSVTTLEISTDGGTTVEALTEGTDFYVNLEDDCIVSASSSFSPYGPAVNSAKLTYIAGYTTLPPELQLAAIELVDHYRQEDFTPKKSLSGTSTDNSGPTQYGFANMLPKHIKRVLDLYRRL